MLPRKFEFLAFVIIVAIIAVFFVAIIRQQTAIPVASLTLLSYTNVCNPLSYFFAGNWLQANIGVKNEGPFSLAYSISPMTENPGPLVKAETTQGWQTNIYWGMTPYTVVLRPGETNSFPIFLPTNTIRWKFTFKVRAASLREQWPIRFLPDREGLDVIIKSSVFEIGSNIIVASQNKELKTNAPN